LAVEAKTENGWLTLHELTTAIDTYVASRVGHRPHSGVLTTPKQSNVRTAKSMIAKTASENPTSWQNYLGFVITALRDVPNETTGVPPWLLAMSLLPRGPLAVLKETWCGESELPPKFHKKPKKYYKNYMSGSKLRKNMQRCIYRRLRNNTLLGIILEQKKQFQGNEKVLILKTTITKSRVFSQWKGPATVLEIKSPHSYFDLDGIKYNLYANKLRKYNNLIEEVTFDTQAFNDESQTKNLVVNFTQIEHGENYYSMCYIF